MFDAEAVSRARQRVLVLKAAYRDAVVNADAASRELIDAELPYPDGQQNYRNALKVERVALEAYMEAIQDLAALTRPGDSVINEPW